MVETEIGYIIGENIATELVNDTQARECVQSIVPVIELPQNYARRMGGEQVDGERYGRVEYRLRPVYRRHREKSPA